MNQPDRYERFMLPEGVRKAEFEADTKLGHTGTYIIQREDHTLGNLVRMKLHDDDSVVFAGYRIPHPLNPLMHVRIQTNGDKTPQEAMKHALRDVKAEISELKQKMEAQINMKEPDRGMRRAPHGLFPDGHHQPPQAGFPPDMGGYQYGGY